MELYDTERLDGKRVAILATDGFEQHELFTPRDALRDAGAEVDLISLKIGEIQGFDHLTPDKRAAVDLSLDQADAEDYDALVLARWHQQSRPSCALNRKRSPSCAPSPTRTNRWA